MKLERGCEDKTNKVLEFVLEAEEWSKEQRVQQQSHKRNIAKANTGTEFSDPEYGFSKSDGDVTNYVGEGLRQNLSCVSG
ncbi:hypothetical protein K3495_g11827 [Podosphaera aphanis]|nr:hypothetical protein K3495_g11827 [Podosphaera aphanis]